MKKLLLLALALCAVSCATTPPAGAGPLNIRFTQPLYENANTCAAPVLVAAVGDATWRGVYSWTGPVSGIDSTYALPGVQVLKTLFVPSGQYTIRVHAAKLANTWLCDTSTVVTVVNVPGVAVLQ